MIIILSKRFFLTIIFFCRTERLLKVFELRDLKIIRLDDQEAYKIRKIED